MSGAGCVVSCLVVALGIPLEGTAKEDRVRAMDPALSVCPAVSQRRSVLAVGVYLAKSGEPGQYPGIPVDLTDPFAGVPVATCRAREATRDGSVSVQSCM